MTITRLTEEEVEQIAALIVRKLCEPENAAAIYNALMNAPIRVESAAAYAHAVWNGVTKK